MKNYDNYFIPVDDMEEANNKIKFQKLLNVYKKVVL
jgi:hypothetical protein